MLLITVTFGVTAADNIVLLSLSTILGRAGSQIFNMQAATARASNRTRFSFGLRVARLGKPAKRKVKTVANHTCSQLSL